MSVNEGAHPDNQSECQGCFEWFDDQCLMRCEPDEQPLCRSCRKDHENAIVAAGPDVAEDV